MMNKLMLGLLLIIFGIGSISIGFVGIFNQHSAKPMTDEQIIERAKILGMVELKEIMTQTENKMQTKTE